MEPNAPGACGHSWRQLASVRGQLILTARTIAPCAAPARVLPLFAVGLAWAGVVFPWTATQIRVWACGRRACAKWRQCVVRILRLAAWLSSAPWGGRCGPQEFRVRRRRWGWD